jgi:hypothetical protein
MVHSEYWLPNDNVVLWIGHKDSMDTQYPTENALILARGDILLFNTRSRLSLSDGKQKQDLLKLSREDFEVKYKLELDYELWTYIKEKIEHSSYPPFLNKQKFSEYSIMISKYIGRIDSCLDEDLVEKFYLDMIRMSLRKLKKMDKKEITIIQNLLR